MRAEDRACSLVLLGIAIAACLGSFQYEVGSFSDPGPGLSPLILGIVLGVLSLAILVGGIMAKRNASPQEKVVKKESIIKKEAVFVVVVLIGYGLLLLPLGFIVTTALVFAVLFKFIADQKWVWSLGEALVLAFGSYVIFDSLLGVPLPRGILSF